MKKLVSVLFALVLGVGLSLVAATPVAAYGSSLTLENKDAGWSVINDTTQGTLLYNPTGLQFDFRFNATGLELDTEYSLIYYADKPDRFVNWGGDNPGALIANFTTDGSGDIAPTSGSVELNMDLPCYPDANIAEISYCGAPDYYTNCHGAKIWLVPTTYLPVDWPNDGSWMNWNADIVSKILFETNLITYDDTGSSVSLTANVPDIVAISVNPTSIDFGTLLPGQTSSVEQVTVTNIGTHTVDVDASASGSALFCANLMLKNEPKDWTDWSVGTPWYKIVEGLAMTQSDGVKAKLSVPSDYTPGGSETATLIFEATAV